MAEIVSRRYAKALFDICVEENSIEKVQEDVTQILNIYDNEEDFKTIMNHPHITAEEKFSLLKNSFGENLSETLYSFFGVVFNKNRETFIYDMLTSFLEFVSEYLGVSVATVASPYPLSDEKIARIEKALSDKFNKKVKANVVLDTSLIGGLVINLDGYLMDSSIKSNIKNLSKQLRTV